MISVTFNVFLFIVMFHRYKYTVYNRILSRTKSHLHLIYILRKIKEKTGYYNVCLILYKTVILVSKRHKMKKKEKKGRGSNPTFVDSFPYEYSNYYVTYFGMKIVWRALLVCNNGF